MKTLAISAIFLANVLGPAHAQTVVPKEDLDSVASVLSALSIYRPTRFFTFTWLGSSSQERVEEITNQARDMCLAFDIRINRGSVDPTCNAVLSEVFLTRHAAYQNSDAVSLNGTLDSRTAMAALRSIERACGSIWRKTEDFEFKFIFSSINTMCKDRAWRYVEDMQQSKEDVNASKAAGRVSGICEDRLQTTRKEASQASQSLSSCVVERDRLSTDNEGLRKRAMVTTPSPQAQSQPQTPSPSPSQSPTGYSAPPSISASRVGSSIVFSATPSSDRDFRCSLNWSISYTDFGSAKYKSNSNTIVVKARQSGTVMTDQTTYTNLQLTSFQHSCA